MRVIGLSDLLVAGSLLHVNSLPYRNLARPVSARVLAGALLLLLSGDLAAPPAQAQSTTGGTLTLSVGGLTEDLPEIDGKPVVGELGTVRFTVTASPTPTSDVEMTIAITPGTAELGDYTPPPSLTHKVTAANPSDYFTIPMRSDTDKDDETLTVTLTITTAGWTWSGSTSAAISETITIVDDDKAVAASLSISPSRVLEGSKVTVTATLSEIHGAVITVPLWVCNDGCSGSTITVNRLSTTGTLDITAAHDTDQDHDDLTVSLSDVLPSLLTAGSPDTVSARVVDDELGNPRIDMTVQTAVENADGTAGSVSVAEGSSLTGTVTLSHEAVDDLHFWIEHSAVSAEADDYEVPVNGVMIPGGQTEATVTITTAHDDDADHEEFTMLLSGVPKGWGIDAPVFTVTIEDDETTTATASLSVSPNPVAEGSLVRVTATLSARLAKAVSLSGTHPLDPFADDTTPGAGTDTAEAGDYATIFGFNIPANGIARTVSIPTYDDADTDSETFTVSLDTTDVGWPSEVTAGSPSAVTVTIVDKDAPRPAVTATRVGGSPITEGTDAVFTVQASPAPDFDLPVNVRITGNAHFVAPETIGARTVTIPKGSASIEVRIPTIDDDTDESDGGLAFRVDDGAWYTGPGSEHLAAILVTDNDEPAPPVLPAVNLSVPPTPVNEGDNVTVTATLSKALADPVTIPLTLALGTAEAGDYGTLASITIDPGATTGTGMLTTTDDADAEHEIFTVALGTLPATVTAGDRPSVSVVIADGDTATPPPVITTVSLSAPPTVAEGAPVTVTARLSEPLAGGVTILLTLRPYTEAAYPYPAEPGDYGTPAGITIAPGATTGTGTITTTADTDSDHDTFIVALGTLPPEVQAGISPAVSVTILDLAEEAGAPPPPPPPPPPAITPSGGADVGVRVSTTAVTVSEAEGEARYTVVLPARPREPVQVTPRSLTPAVVVQPAALTFTPATWAAPQTVTVRGVNDAVDNGQAGRQATIVHAVTGGGASGVLAAPVTVTVTDDDTAGVTVSAAGVRVSTGGGTARYTVVLDTEPLGAVRVTPRSSAPETATVSGPLTFTPGTWNDPQPVTVRVAPGAPVGRRVTLTHGVAGYGGVTTAASVTVTVSALPASLPRAWLSRLGRTIGTHMTDAVGVRLRDPAGLDSHVTVGGYRLSLKSGESLRGAALLEGLAGFLGLGPGGSGRPEDAFGGWETDPRRDPGRPVHLDLRRVLVGSSFRLNLGAAGGASSRLTAWGRVAGTRFDGRDGALTLDGDVLTGTVGVDRAWGRWLAGLAVSHSRGDGGYARPRAAASGQRGELDAALTSLHPYLRYRMTDRLDVWGLLGYGWGSMTLAPATGPAVETDTTLLMGAVGSRGILLPAAEHDGFELATRTDLMLTRMTSGGGAGLAGADGDAHRLRLILEGSRGVTWEEGRRLTPTLELGLRHDWGDAETGFGMELGGRVQYVDPTLGLTVEGAVRGLLAHADGAYQEWGAQGTLRLDPGALQPGLALTVAPGWGAAASGVEDLWARQTTAGLAPRGPRAAPGGRLNAEVGYGLAAPFGTGLVTPYAGTVLTAGADRTYRVGTRVQVTGPAAGGLTLRLEGTRREAGGAQPVNQGLRLQADWQF